MDQKRPCSWTVLVALNLQKAFDTVSISKPLNDISNIKLPTTAMFSVRVQPSMKSTYTLLIFWTKIVKTELDIKNCWFPYSTEPENTRWFFRPIILTFRTYTIIPIPKLKNRNTGLKSISDCTWGKEKEKKFIAYNAISHCLQYHS